MWRPECSGAVVPVPTPTSGPTLGATPPRRKPICALTAECGVCAAGKIQFAKETHTYAQFRLLNRSDPVSEEVAPGVGI